MLCEDKTLKKVFDIMPKLEKTFFSNYFREVHQDLDLNKTHTRTIMMLHFEGDVPMSFVSQKLGLEKGSFTPVAKTLINMGYVKKVKSENDKRISLLSLTEQGKEYAKTLKKGHHAFMNDQINKLNEEEQASFEDALDTILNHLKKMNDE